MSDAESPQPPPYDAATSLQVLHEILERGFTWRNELAADIAEPDFGAIPAEYQSDMLVDSMYTHTYRDAACSHAAVGALAPFFEGVFHHEFAALRDVFGGRKAVNKCHRWRLNPDDFWSPSAVSDDGTFRENPDIARGVRQLIKALDISNYFPDEVHETVNALFTFRNCALHNGYEWPVHVRSKFFKIVSEHKQWTDWFYWSTCGGELWIVTLTDPFVSDCLKIAGATIKGFKDLRGEWTKDGGSR